MERKGLRCMYRIQPSLGSRSAGPPLRALLYSLQPAALVLLTTICLGLPAVEALLAHQKRKSLYAHGSHPGSLGLTWLFPWLLLKLVLPFSLHLATPPSSQQTPLS